MKTANLKIPAFEQIPARLLRRRSMPAQPRQLTTPNPMLRVGSMSPYRPTRREFLIGTGSLLLLAPYGCGSGGESGGGGGDGSGGMRAAEHMYGEVELPADPQRMVATVLPLVTDHALVLGIPLVGSPGANGFAQAPFPEYQRERYPDRLEGVEKVQGRPEMNFEQIATLNPDCILAIDPGEDVYESLSGIAPTFVYPFTYETEVDGETLQQFNWERNLRTIAGAFGRRQQADEYLADYQARTEDLSGRLAERWGDATFATVSFFNEQLSVSGYGVQTDSLILFEDLGLTPAPFVNPGQQTLSLEEIPRLDAADVLFLSVPPRAAEGSLGRDREALAPLLDSPLWQRLPAVRNDQVFEVRQEATYVSPLSADAFLDLVERALLG